MPYTKCHPLVIEDEPSYAALITTALERAGVVGRHIRVLTNGADAMEFLQSTAQANTPTSFIILDCHLRGMSGLDLLEKMKADPKMTHIPVFMLTSTEDPKEVVRAFDLGVRSFFGKPLDFESLMDTVQGMLAHWSNRMRRSIGPSQAG